MRSVITMTLVQTRSLQEEHSRDAARCRYGGNTDLETNVLLQITKLQQRDAHAG